MSDKSIVVQRDTKTGRFLAGNNGGGRKPGSRNKLSESFIADVQGSWEKHRAEVLERGGAATMADNTGEQQAGRFRKGRSGNPAGRPLGARNATTMAAEALLEGEAERLTRKCIELALAGDTVALRLALERICPPRRDRAATFALRPIHSARDAAEAQSDLADAVSSGIITPAEAAEISKVLANAAKAYEIAEMAERTQLDQMTDTELLRVIAMGENGADIAKQVSGLLTIGPR